MFLVKAVVTARPRNLFVTSPIPTGLTPGFLCKGISLHAKKVSSNPLFPQYLLKHNFFAMSAIAPQRFRLLFPNDDEVRMRYHTFASRFDGPAASLISRAILHTVHRLFLHMHVLHIILPGRVVKGRRILGHLQDVFL